MGAGRELSVAPGGLRTVRPVAASALGGGALQPGGLLSTALPCSGSSFRETALEKRLPWHTMEGRSNGIFH